MGTNNYSSDIFKPSNLAGNSNKVLFPAMFNIARPHVGVVFH